MLHGVITPCITQNSFSLSIPVLIVPHSCTALRTGHSCTVDVLRVDQSFLPICISFLVLRSPLAHTSLVAVNRGRVPRIVQNRTQRGAVSVLLVPSCHVSAGLGTRSSAACFGPGRGRRPGVPATSWGGGRLRRAEPVASSGVPAMAIIASRPFCSPRSHPRAA